MSPGKRGFKGERLPSLAGSFTKTSNKQRTAKPVLCLHPDQIHCEQHENDSKQIITSTDA